MKFTSKYIARFFGCAVLALALNGCTSDEPTPSMPSADEYPGLPVSEVDIALTLGSDWNVDLGDDPTRAMPPGIDNNHDDNGPVDGSEDLNAIDRVRVVAFRRIDPETVENTEAEPNAKEKAAAKPFVYDRTNDTILIVKDGTGMPGEDLFPADPNHKTHRVATGKIRKVYNFEYRIVALAYSTTQESAFKNGLLPNGDPTKFTMNIGDGLTYDQFEANLTTLPISSSSWNEFFHATTQSNTGCLGTEVLETPQFFFGECYTQVGSRKSEIIKYSEEDEEGVMSKDVGIRGVLYRGVAKIEVNILMADYRPSITPFQARWIALMADCAPTNVKLQNYDCFLPINITQINSSGFKPMAFQETESGKNAKIETYILPCRSRLAIRVKNSNNLGTVGYIRNGWLKAGDSETGQNGTGIISPDSHDGYFYFRRNHKYVINVTKINSDELIRNGGRELK